MRDAVDFGNLDVLSDSCEPIEWSDILLRARLERGVSRLKEAGLIDSVSLVAWRSGMRRGSLTMRARAKRRLRAVFDDVPATQQTIIIKSTQDYASPFLQRYQHLARALAEQGACVVFVPSGAGYDRVFTVKTIAPGLHISPHLDVALDGARAPILMLFSTDSDISPDLIERARSRGRILYDYLDVFDDRLSNHPISPQRRAMHADLLADSQVLCIASSQALFDQVAAARTANFCLVPNGVGCIHFAVTRQQYPPSSLNCRWAGTGRPVAGYFGALAAWLDTELVIATATRMPHLQFVLIGPDLDGTGERLKASRLSNLIVEAAIPYSVLPRTAIWFDVGLIPFKLEPLTDAVSPLKLFEYLALGLPVVATPFHEIMTNEFVSIATGADAFASAISRALDTAGDTSLQSARKSYATDADWSVRAQRILALVEHSC